MSSSSDRERTIFFKALEIADPAQRQKFVEETCAGFDELRAAVEDLLKAQNDADQFISEGASSLISPPGGMADILAAAEDDGAPILEVAPGTRVGRYKVVQKIGEGGCGAVYLAEQEEPVRRRVALKVVKHGMDTKTVIARFEAERQALARMDHPNIARVLDAGATDSGRPFFIMELVHGLNITDYCDQNRFGMEPRLELFMTICQAIEHAHQKGIIHRDIKPSNILVSIRDGVAVPKVIDFGIAKAIGERLTDQTLFTAYGQFIGTPAYMSPEQIDSLDLDTRSDIYSLGVLLYELLTGRTPFDTRELIKSGFGEMRRALVEREPCAPSASLQTLGGEELARMTTKRREEPRRLASKLRGDLDWIIMKALEKNRSRRYATASELAKDIQRHLQNEPVLAGPPKLSHVLQKWIRRNRIVFISGVIIVITLLGGAGMSVWLYQQEGNARRKEIAAQRETDSLRDAETLAKVAQAQVLLARVDFTGADELLDGIALIDPSADAAETLRKVGHWDASNNRWPQAVARFKLLVQADGKDILGTVMMDYLELCPALLKVGDLQGYERFRQEALARYAAPGDAYAAALIMKLSLLLPANPQFLHDLTPQAELVEKTISAPDARLRADPRQESWYAMSLALYEYRRAHYAKAAEWSERCLAFPEYVAPRSAAAEAILAMSRLQLDQRKDALVALEQAREMMAETFKPGPKLKIGPPHFWFDQESARILLRECEERFKEVDRSAAQIAKPQPGQERAALLREQGGRHARRNELREAADCFEALVKVNQGDDGSIATLDYTDYGVILAELGDAERFDRMRQEAIARFNHTGNQSIARRIVKISLLRPADNQLLASLAPLAETMVRPLNSPKESGRDNVDFNSWSKTVQALLEYRRGDYDKAADWSRRSLAMSDAPPFSISLAHLILAMALRQLGRDDDARLELQQGHDLIEIKLKNEDDQRNWRDWLFGHVLLREAAKPLPGAVPPAEPKRGAKAR